MFVTEVPGPDRSRTYTCKHHTSVHCGNNLWNNSPFCIEMLDYSLDIVKHYLWNNSPFSAYNCWIKALTLYNTISNTTPVADPGFPVGGGAPTRWGAPTSDAYTFQWKRTWKWKKLILLGGTHHGPPAGSANELTILHTDVGLVLEHSKTGH